MNTDFEVDLPSVASQTGLDVWQLMSRVIIGLLTLIVMIAICSLFWPELERKRQIEDQIGHLHAQEAELKAKRDLLKEEYVWLRDDPNYAEMIARDRLDFQKDGEVIVRFQ